MQFRFRGLTFGGRANPIIVTDWQAPATDLRGGFVDRLGRDGALPERQYLGTGSWQISVSTNASNLVEALALTAELEAAWKNSSVRASTSAAPLDYSLDEGATWRRVYGRPGKYAPPTDTVHAKLGAAAAELEWVQTDPNHYSASEHQVTITAAASSVGGIVAPLVAPITTVASGEARSGIIDNDGDQPSPVRVRFYGPSSNPKLVTDKGKTIAYAGSLAYDEWVEISAWDGTSKLNTGAAVAGRIDRRTRILDLNVPAGRSVWTYSASDVSGTSRAVVYWRDAHTAMQ